MQWKSPSYLPNWRHKNLFDIIIAIVFSSARSVDFWFLPRSMSMGRPPLGECLEPWLNWLFSTVGNLITVIRTSHSPTSWRWSDVLQCKDKDITVRDDIIQLPPRWIYCCRLGNWPWWSPGQASSLTSTLYTDWSGGYCPIHSSWWMWT